MNPSEYFVNKIANHYDDLKIIGNEKLIPLIKHFDSVAQSYGNILDLSSLNRRVLNLLRYYKYGNTGSMFAQLSWFGTLGDDDSDFVAHVYGFIRIYKQVVLKPLYMVRKQIYRILRQQH